MSLIPGVPDQETEAGLGAVLGGALFGPPGLVVGGLLGWLLGGGFFGGAKQPPAHYTGPIDRSQTPQGIIDAAGADVAAAVAAAVATGDTTTIAQAHTISVTGGDPSLQGIATYTDPSAIPDPRARAAWNTFVAQMKAVAAQTNQMNPSVQDGLKVYAAVKQYGPPLVGALGAAGIALGGGAAGGSAAGLGILPLGSVVGVLAIDAGLLAYDLVSLVNSFGANPDYAQSPADYALAEDTAAAYIENDPQLLKSALAVYNGTATPTDYAYVSEHALSVQQIQGITTDQIIASGTGWKELRDPTAPGGYIIVGSTYGVKQAQTSAQNAYEAQFYAGNTHNANSDNSTPQAAGGMTLAQQQAFAKEEAAYGDPLGNSATPI